MVRIPEIDSGAPCTKRGACMAVCVVGCTPANTMSGVGGGGAEGTGAKYSA